MKNNQQGRNKMHEFASENTCKVNKHFIKFDDE
jgi:hypothetical protein